MPDTLISPTGPSHDVFGVFEDVLWLGLVVYSMPFAILALGMPFVFLWWVLGWLFPGIAARL